MTTRNPFDLHPAIAALCGGPVPQPFDWAGLERLTGCSRETYFAGLANMLLVAGERTLAGYQAQERRARAARHRAYSLGVVEAPRRMTRADRILADARAFGLVGRAA